MTVTSPIDRDVLAEQPIVFVHHDLVAFAVGVLESIPVEDLCSEGWHVCMDRTEVMDDGVANCNDETISWGGNSFYATRQSGEGANTCNPTGLNDVFGCGDVGYTNIEGCAPLNRGSANLCNQLPAPWECGVSITQEADFIVKPDPQFGGVLCCRD